MSSYFLTFCTHLYFCYILKLERTVLAIFPCLDRFYFLCITTSLQQKSTTPLEFSLLHMYGWPDLAISHIITSARILALLDLFRFDSFWFFSVNLCYHSIPIPKGSIFICRWCGGLISWCCSAALCLITAMCYTTYAPCTLFSLWWCMEPLEYSTSIMSVELLWL